jgi:hypothetical protein
MSLLIQSATGVPVLSPRRQVLALFEVAVDEPVQLSRHHLSRTRGLHSKASLVFTCRRGRFHRQLPRTFVMTAQELRIAGPRLPTAPPSSLTTYGRHLCRQPSQAVTLACDNSLWLHHNNNFACDPSKTRCLCLITRSEACSSSWQHPECCHCCM